MEFIWCTPENIQRFTPRGIVADLMGQKFIIPVMDLLLLLMAVKSYVIQLLIASTFPTAKNGTTVNCAPNAISPPVETLSTTLLGRGSRKVRCSKIVKKLNIILPMENTD